jgi:hypothetical protein
MTAFGCGSLFFFFLGARECESACRRRKKPDFAHVTSYVFGRPADRPGRRATHDDGSHRLLKHKSVHTVHLNFGYCSIVERRITPLFN